jgi:Mn2+/Fe2+ NRAMP family transporter
VANTINIGADIGAMGDALALVTGGPRLLFVVAFGGISIALQILLRYADYVRFLKWLTLALFAYVATLFMVEIDWLALARGLVVPSIAWNRDYVTAIVAIFGTTISPYLFFWQSSQEVEDIHEKPEREPLVEAPEQATAAEQRIRLDTLVGMALSNLVALSIMVTTAATLHIHGVTDIASSAQAAAALRPIAGSLAELVFALGIVGTGLLAVPVLAGSAAYAAGEALKWPTGLARQFREARAFYVTIIVATLMGVALVFTPIEPMRALFWSAVINGVVAVPVMLLMMRIASQVQIMGVMAISGPLKLFGWAATVAMALAVVAMAATALV